MSLATTDTTALAPANRGGPYDTLASRLGWGDNIAAFHAAMLDQVFRPGRNGGRPSPAAMGAFAHVCNEFDLNPLRREIFALYDESKDICLPYVSVDGWIKRMTGHPDWDGYESEFVHDAAGELVSCTVRLYRKNLSRPVVHTEYLCENRKSKSADKQYGPWWDRPRRMLLWKALMQAIRIGFGISGLMDEDEAHEALANGERPAAPAGGVAAKAREAAARLTAPANTPATAPATPEVSDAELLEGVIPGASPAQDAPAPAGRPETPPSAPDAPAASHAPAKDTQELDGGWTRVKVATVAEGRTKAKTPAPYLSVVTTDGERLTCFSTRLFPVLTQAKEDGGYIYLRLDAGNRVEEATTELPAPEADALL